MADRIIINTEEMQAAVTAYEAQKTAKMDAIAAMKSAVETMDGSWDGPASEAFMATFNVLYGKMMHTEEKMADAIAELNGLIAKAEEDNQTVTDLAKGAEASAAMVTG